MAAVQPEYHRPSTVEAACGLLSAADRPEIVAGGQSLTLSLDDRAQLPDVLVDITDVDSLTGIERDGDTLAVGATVTHREIETTPIVERTVPALATAASEIADVQIRNAGTIGGTTAFRYHTADYPPVLVAADATIVSQDETGRRERGATTYFTEPETHQLGPTELITEIRVPVVASNQAVAYTEFSFPGHTRALVNVAVSVTVEDGTCVGARVAVGSVGDHPQTVPDAADALVGSSLSDGAVETGSKRARNSVSVTDDRTSVEYIRHVVGRVTEQTLQTARERVADQ
jgi:CO/xanthine dehydrogenase FAD-binding subunit